MSAAQEERDDEIEETDEASKEDTHEGVSTIVDDAANGKEDEDNDGKDEDEEEEPQLKYSRLTGNLTSIYRNGDSTSAFSIAGDKMVIGTHSGSINVLSLPTFQPLKSYRAHSASITSVSVSPFPLPLPTSKPEAPAETTAEEQGTPSKSGTRAGNLPASPKSNQRTIPATPSNSIHIATSSIDGHVCISSLIDPNDVMLRNFARPVHAVALSPEYKFDRAYLSGGLAGSLILTIGGRAGVSSDAKLSSAAATASGWLSSIGLSSDTGKDTVLHSGEGSISTIKWSLSGKYVVWVNERGIKIMRSNLRLVPDDADFAWKRIAHVDRPSRDKWEDMASVWKARAEWIDDKNLEKDNNPSVHLTQSRSNGVGRGLAPNAKEQQGNRKVRKNRVEKLVLGWGDTAWVLHVNPEGAGVGKSAGERSAGSADIVQILRFDDCIVSGLSLYTPSLLVVLAYRTRDDNDNLIPSSIQDTPRRGRHSRQNGVPPQLRLVDFSGATEDEDTLPVSRFESLSAADYHLGTMYVPPLQPSAPAQRGALEAMGGLWDVGVNATRMFSSGASILSIPSSGEPGRSNKSATSVSASNVATTERRRPPPNPSTTTPGLKIFIQSPYDCILAVKRDLSDHFTWLIENEKYSNAWNLIDQRPHVISPDVDKQSESAPSTPSRKDQSLADFLADDDASKSTVADGRGQNSAVEKEKRRIGELWMQQLVKAERFAEAGQVAGKVLGTTAQWEQWVWRFAQADRFDEITRYIPTRQLHPPLPSLVYEVVLGHYILHDRLQLKLLLERWELELFDVNSVARAIEDKLKAGDVRQDTVEDGERGRDWRILMEGLAKLYLADGRPKEALTCYIKLQNGDAAMTLISEYHLLDAISDDIPGLLLLRVLKEQLDSASLEDLEEASSEAVHLLVDAAYQGIVRPQTVVDQLHTKGLVYQPFLFIYLRALWKGEGSVEKTAAGRQRIADEGKLLVEEFGDLAIELFAEYDRPLLMEYLQSSTSYDYEKASTICETRNYVEELVYLLSRSGQTKRALDLILFRLDSVETAISFCKAQADPDLWDDLLSYSMDKPTFIVALLSSLGVGEEAVDPIKLVRTIPENLHIEGLREALSILVGEFKLQLSISEGVARVLRGEVGRGMDTLRAGRKRAIKFQVITTGREEKAELEIRVKDPIAVNGRVDAKGPAVKSGEKKIKGPKPGHCAGCEEMFHEDEHQTLIGFACGHVYHLACLLDYSDDDNAAAVAAELQLRISRARQAEDGEDEDGYGGEYDDGDGYGYGEMGSQTQSRSVAAKVTHAQMIRSALRSVRGLGGGCPIEVVEAPAGEG